MTSEKKNKKWPTEFKNKVVQEYLTGNYTVKELAKKYGFELDMIFCCMVCMLSYPLGIGPFCLLTSNKRVTEFSTPSVSEMCQIKS